MLGTQELLQAPSKLQTLLHSFANATHHLMLINQEQKYLNTIKRFNIIIGFLRGALDRAYVIQVNQSHSGCVTGNTSKPSQASCRRSLLWWLLLLPGVYELF